MEDYFKNSSGITIAHFIIYIAGCVIGLMFSFNSCLKTFGEGLLLGILLFPITHLVLTKIKLKVWAKILVLVLSTYWIYTESLGRYTCDDLANFQAYVIISFFIIQILFPWRTMIKDAIVEK